MRDPNPGYDGNDQAEGPELKVCGFKYWCRQNIFLVKSTLKSILMTILLWTKQVRVVLCFSSLIFLYSRGTLMNECDIGCFKHANL